jgi:signal transduction histidine kinase
MKKKNLGLSFYMIFAGLGLLISFGVCSIMYLQFNNHVKKTYFDTLANVTRMIEKQHPFLHDKDKIKKAVKADEQWFWDFHQEMTDIVEAFDLAYIYYFEKTEDGVYVTLMDTSFPRDDANWLERPVWIDIPVPDGVEEAWLSKEITFSPHPSDEGEWGILVSAYLPVLNDGETAGIIGADYDISYVNAMVRKVLYFLIVAFAASVLLVGLLAFFGAHTVLMPVVEQKRIADEAKEQNRKIETLMRALKAAFATRTAFLNGITSDMSDPINNIIQTSSELLEDAKIPEEEHKSIELINDSGIILFNAISDILDISKLESGKMDFHPADYELPGLVSSITMVFTTNLDNKDVHFDIIMEKDMPFHLIGDELHIKKICHRLLTNAFKYTSKGAITFKISCKREKDFIWLVMQVSDTGSGMSKADLENHLEDYGKINIEHKLKKGGTTGLGLYIVRRMAEIMGGRLIANSEKGKGSSFTLHVPQKLVSAENVTQDVIEKLKTFQYVKEKAVKTEQPAAPAAQPIEKTETQLK